MAAVFSPWHADALVYVALVPLAVILVDRKSRWGVCAGAYLGGCAFHLVDLDWIRTAYGGAGLAGPMAPHWLAQAALLGLSWPALVAVGRCFVRTSGWPMTLALPVLWGGMELARMKLWYLVDETGDPWSLLGYSQSEQQTLIQAADVSGIIGVSMVVALVNGLAFDLGRFAWRRWHAEPARPPWISLAAGVAMLIAIAGYGTWRVKQQAASPGPTVCLMPRWHYLFAEPSLNDPTEMEKAGSHFVNRADERTDILFWPEATLRIRDGHEANPHSPSDSPKILALERFARSAGAILAIGCHLERPGGTTNSVIHIDPVIGYRGAYDKLRLVPFSEFQPPIGRCFGSGEDRYRRGTDWTVFELSTGANCGKYRLAATICYDAAFGELYREFMRQPGGIDFFLLASSETFDATGAAAETMRRMTRVRAIETRRSIVRNATGGLSGVIDGNGQIVASPEVADFREPTYLGAIPLDERCSLFVLFGQWLPGVCCLVVAMVVARACYRALRAASSV